MEEFDIFAEICEICDEPIKPEDRNELNLCPVCAERICGTFIDLTEEAIAGIYKDMGLEA